MFVGLAVVALLIVPFHVRIGGIKVKCGAPALAVSVPDIPDQCRPPAVLRLAAAGAVLALGMVIAALGHRAEYRQHREPGSGRQTMDGPRGFLARRSGEEGERAPKLG